MPQNLPREAHASLWILGPDRASTNARQDLVAVTATISRTLCRSLAVLMLLAASACERFDSRFETAATAKAELGRGGWWPEEMPKSATKIEEVHDLDTNQQNITFRFPPEECKSLEAARAADGSALPGVRSYALAGWPVWLTGAVTPEGLSGRGALVVKTREGAMALMCEHGRGYFWR